MFVELATGAMSGEIAMLCYDIPSRANVSNVHVGALGLAEGSERSGTAPMQPIAN